MPRLADVGHEAFARHYVVLRDNADAADAAGFVPLYGAQLMQRPEIRARIIELTENMLKAEDITAARVMLELGRLAFGDIRQAFDKDGALIPIHEMGDDAAAMIAGIEHETRTRRSTGRARQQVNLATGEMEDIPDVVTTRTAKIKRYDKAVPLTTLAKHFKLVGDEGDGVNALASALADRLKSARKRIIDDDARKRTLTKDTPNGTEPP